MNLSLLSTQPSLPAFASSAAPARVSFYPNIVTGRFHETWDFYTTHLGFRTEAAWDTYVHLVHACGAQLGVLKHETNDHLPELVSATNGCGWWLGLDVADVDETAERLSAEGVEFVASLANQPWGERNFTVRDPNGVLICIGCRLDLASAGDLVDASRTR